MEFARKIKDEEKGGRATMVLSTPDDERLREKFYDQVLSLEHSCSLYGNI